MSKIWIPITLILLIAAIFILPWGRINWGRISILPAATITVTGTSQGEVKNQIATFNATITSTNADKQKAIDDVNTRMAALIKSIKDYGIADNDIKTQQISAYQQQTEPQTLIYPPMPVKPGNGDWYAANTIEITVRNVDKSSGLADIINRSNATNVYGPSLTTDPNNTQNDAQLLTSAVEDARKKAESTAKASGVSLGRVINVQENGGGNYPVAYAMDAKLSSGSAPTPVQPGTSTLYKSVTVTFELK